jgi:uncharacterized protein YigA (DUF484 family)
MTRRKQTATRNQAENLENPGSSPAETGADGITGAQVADYIRAHPSFLSTHSDLLRTLTPSPRYEGGNVVDMQAFIIEQLRMDHDDLLTTSRGNMVGQSRVHEAALSFLSAHSLEHLVHLVTTDLAVILGLDVVALCVESVEAESVAMVRVLSPGTVNRLLDGGHEVRLDGETEADPTVYGGMRSLVRSQILIRLEFGGRESTGLLALGSREKDKFHASQGKELFTFLARVTEYCVRSWLDRLQ